MSETKKSQFALIEEAMLKAWDQAKTFEKSLKQRQNSPVFSFYDGPPFASGEPHYGHVEQTAVKDALNRYKTMRGYYVPRRTGYDTHGLPIEYLVEKELGLKSKQDIVKYGIAKFNQACRDIVFRHRADFEDMYYRLGRWGDPKEAYATLDPTYTESVWWVFSELYRQGLIYRGYKSIAYCPRCATPLSNFEVNDGYKDNVSDPSLYVKFKLSSEEAYLLVWTTTPWSLPGNVTLAVNPDETYVLVETNGQKLLLAEKRLGVIDGDYHILKELKADELVGKSYEPLFKVPAERLNDSSNLYRVIAEAVVSTEEGTGVLHVAPAFGEDDLNIGQKYGLPVVHSVDENGKMRSDSGLGSLAGEFFKAADEHIIAELSQRGLVYSVDSSFTHTYPFCWRCETPLLYYAINSWFVAVSKIQPELLKAAEETNWTPKHVKKGRFINWLEGARDWAISRNRFWGAPLPVWVNQEDQSDFIVVGSTAQLKELAGPDIDLRDLHRPFIDKIGFVKDGKTYKRVTEVFDCWFESGSMPYAQDHYPFDNKDKFAKWFPADFVVEAIEQVHLWFYTLHVLATALTKQPAYKNVVADGLILAADGKKLSKRLRNYPPINQLLDNYGADTTRFFILSSPLMDGEDTRLEESVLRDIYRNVFMTLYNSFSFFKTYADIDKWQPPKRLTEPKTSSVLDKWLLARLNQTIEEVTAAADQYRIARATRPLIDLLDDLSNWYIRRSRRRFWKSQNDKDKDQAYQTLHYVLVRTCQLLAPWAPFLSDHIHQELTKGTNLSQSVHLSDWPLANEVDGQILDDMAKARQYINEGLALRAAAGLKVRQPLAEAKLPELPASLLDMVKDELNVKKVLTTKSEKVQIDLNITEELKIEGIMRDLVRFIQNTRKQAGLQVDDRIHLNVASADELVQQALKSHAQTIKAETLALSINQKPAKGHEETVKINGQTVTIKLYRED